MNLMPKCSWSRTPRVNSCNTSQRLLVILPPNKLQHFIHHHPSGPQNRATGLCCVLRVRKPVVQSYRLRSLDTLFSPRSFYEEQFIGKVTHVPSPFSVFSAELPDTHAARK